MSRSLEIYLLGRFEVRVDGQHVSMDSRRRPVTLHGGASELRSRISSPIDPADQAAHQRRLASLREQTGEPVLESAWRRGGELAISDTLAYACDTLPAEAPPPKIP